MAVCGEAICARSTLAACLLRSDEEGLARLVEEIKDEGCSASGYILNAVEEGTIEERAMEIERDIGPIEVVVYNLGSQIGDRNLQVTSYRAFEMGWRLATFGLFRTASVVTAKMEERVEVRH